MKQIVFAIFTLGSFLSYGQLSHEIIPKDAVTVLSINNMSVFNKITLDELIQYDFMIDIQQEIFDGSTNGYTIKDAGIDFDQKLNAFYGKTFNYEISGFSFGVTDKAQLFRVFDDFVKLPTNQKGVERYTSYLNQLILFEKSALLVRLEPLQDYTTRIADSIWYSRGNDFYFTEDDLWADEEGIDQTILQLEEEALRDEAKVYDDEIDISSDSTFEVRDIVSGKTYWELRDSVMFSLQRQYSNDLLKEIASQNINLYSTDARFAEKLKSNADGILFLDNSRNLQKDQTFWYFRSMFPTLYEDLNTLYTGNVILGDIYLNDGKIDLKVKAQYGDQLGTIYYNLNNAKLDKNIFKYIPNDNSGFFTYNVNLRNAYNQAYKVLFPILDKEPSAQISMNLMMLELFDEFVNKDALFDSYKGSLFGSFNGIQKVKTRKYVFTYDEDTFEYSEEEVEAEEDMPVFTFGLTTGRNDIMERFLYRLQRITPRMNKVNDYYVFDEAILESAPVYIINKKGLLIVTNDFNVAETYSNGYGKKALNSKTASKVKKSGFVYAELDWKKSIDQIPRDLFTPEQIEILEALNGKGGYMTLTSSKTTNKETNFHVVYEYDTALGKTGKYLLDFVNSLYLLSK